MQAFFTAITAAGGCVLFVLAAFVFRSRYPRGAKEMAAALLAMSAWVWCASLEQHVADFALYMLVVKVKYSAIAIAPACVALGVYAYAGHKRVGARGWAGAFVLPAATIALIWTNEAHEWMWAHPPLGPLGERTMLMPWGPWFWRVHVPGSYALSAFAVAVLGRELFGRSRLDRSRLVLLSVGVLLPLATNALYTGGLLPWRVGPTPLAITVSGLVFAWGFLRRGLFRLAPIAQQAVFEQMRDGVLVTDAAGRVQLANPAALVISGRSESALLDASVLEALPADARVGALLEASSSASIDTQSASGQHIEIAMSPIRDARGFVGARVFLLRDVSERERVQRSLRESEALVRGIVEHSPNGILRLRPRRGHDGDVRDFDCLFANAAAAVQLGRTASELIGRPFKGAVHPHTAALFQAFREALERGERCEVERSFGRAGRDGWLRFLAVPAAGDLIVTCIDVTDAKLRERAMQAAASEDSLTGLLNRRGLDADGPSVLCDSAGAQRLCAALYLDLDRFKAVNDEFGHETGDLVLCEFAARLQRCTRGPDLLARLGGDEFVVLLPDTRLEGALWVARRVLEAARVPVRVNAREIACAPSIGVALYPDDGPDLKALVQAADRAMYAAKAAGLGITVAARVAPSH